MAIKLTLVWLAAILGLLIAISACNGASEKPETATSMKIGLLLNFSGSPEASANRKRAFDLAIQHINEGGGVLGRPVESIAADVTLDPLLAVEGWLGALWRKRAWTPSSAPTGSGGRIACRGDCCRAGGHPDDQPLGHLSPVDQSRGQRLLLSHDPFRYRSGPGPSLV